MVRRVYTKYVVFFNLLRYRKIVVESKGLTRVQVCFVCERTESTYRTYIGLYLTRLKAYSDVEDLSMHSTEIFILPGYRCTVVESRVCTARRSGCVASR